MLILEDLTQPYLLMKTMFAPPRVPISLSCSSEDFMKMLTELFFFPLCSSVCRRGRSSILLQGMRLCFSWTPTKRFLLFIQESRSGFLPLFRMNTLQLFLIKFPFCCSPQESSVQGLILTLYHRWHTAFCFHQQHSCKHRKEKITFRVSTVTFTDSFHVPTGDLFPIQFYCTLLETRKYQLLLQYHKPIFLLVLVLWNLK